MYRNIVKHNIIDRNAFVLTEVVVASLIMLFIFSGAWSIYRMAWQWWHETAPLIEAQRVVRITLSSVIDGMIDSTVGKDATYGRRNGIGWAVYEPAISSSVSVADKIEFGLEKEKESFGDYPTPHNVRAFYLGVDQATGLRVIYYRDNSSKISPIKSTLGITDLKFEKFIVNNKIHIKVTAKVEKDVIGTRSIPYHIKIEYVDYIFLRNV